MKKQLPKISARRKSRKPKSIPTPAEQFAKLWKKVQKEKASISTALTQQAEIVALFNEQALHTEIALNNQLYLETQHLIHFLAKKSLSDHQRKLLFMWIDNQLGLLRARPFGTSHDIEVLVSIFEDCLEEFPDDDDVDLFPDDSGSHPSEEDEFDFEIGDEIDENDGPKFYEDYLEEDDDPIWGAQIRADKKEAEELFNSSSINKMFRQLAKILHPDLEQDDEKKVLKHQQMAELLRAREDQDVLTIFNLFCTHGGKGLPSFDDQELKRLNQLLEQQLMNLRFEKEDALRENPMHYAIYIRFNCKNPELIRLAFEDHKKELNDAIKLSREFIKRVNTLKALKTEIRSREMKVHAELMASVGLDPDFTFDDFLYDD